MSRSLWVLLARVDVDKALDVMWPEQPKLMKLVKGSFTPILHQANFRHKKNNPNRLVFLGKFGRHERI